MIILKFVFSNYLLFLKILVHNFIISYVLIISIARETGLLVLGKREQPYFDGVIESFIDNKMEYELYNPDELKRKFSNLTMANDEWGCYDPAGGVLLADKCLKSVWVCVIF